MAHPTRNPTASEFNPPNDLPQQDVADLDLWSEGAHRPGVQPLLADTAYPPTYRQSEDGARLTSTQISDGVTVTVACPAPHVDYAPFAGAGSTLSTSPIVDSSFAVDPFVRDSQTIDPRLAFPYPSALATHSTPPVVPFLTQVNHSNSNAYNYHAGGQFVSQSFQASPQAGFDTPFPLPVAGPIDTHDLQAPSIGLVGGSLSGPRIDFPQVFPDLHGAMQTHELAMSTTGGDHFTGAYNAPMAPVAPLPQASLVPSDCWDYVGHPVMETQSTYRGLPMPSNGDTVTGPPGLPTAPFDPTVVFGEPVMGDTVTGLPGLPTEPLDPSAVFHQPSLYGPSYNESARYPSHNLGTNPLSLATPMATQPVDHWSSYPRLTHPSATMSIHTGISHLQTAVSTSNLSQGYMGNTLFPSIPWHSGTEHSVTTPGTGFNNLAASSEPVIDADEQQAPVVPTTTSRTPPYNAEAPVQTASKAEEETGYPHTCVWDPNCGAQLSSKSGVRAHIRDHSRRDNFAEHKDISPSSRAPCGNCGMVCRWDNMVRHYFDQHTQGMHK